jgi:aminotransferase
VNGRITRQGEQATSLRYRIMELASSLDDVISLGRGDPDLATPADIWEAALRKLERPLSSTPVRGSEELRAAIARRYALENGLSFDPEREILITNGGQEALFLAMLALVDPGDRVATPDPRYSSYDQAAVSWWRSRPEPSETSCFGQTMCVRTPRTPNCWC